MAIQRILKASLLIGAATLIVAGCAAGPAATPANGERERQQGVQSMVGQVDIQAAGPGVENTPQGFVAPPVTEQSTPEQHMSGGATPEPDLPGAQPQPAQEGGPVSWQTYHNADYGFSVDVPSSFVMQPDRAQPQPQPLAQFAFQDSAIAASDPGGPEPPQFSIRVYDAAGQASAEDWLKNEGVLARYGAGADVQPYTVGGVDGVRVTSLRMMAPNSAVYVAHGGYIFELTPLGPLSEQMLGTFAFN